MLIDDLIRMGRPLDAGALEPQEILPLISDVANPNARNFFQHVFVVELDARARNPVVLPVQVWGEFENQRKKRPDFAPDPARAVAAPFVLPSGGNPLNPQGRYAGVYPCWDRHIRGFHQSVDAVRAFLPGRLDRTSRLSLDDETLEQVAIGLHEAAQTVDTAAEKLLGLVVVAACGTETPYVHTDERRTDAIGESRHEEGRSIVPRYDALLEAAWDAILEQGRESGRRSGPCTLCGQGDEVVSFYAKAWPWAFPTWTCPLPLAGRDDMMVESIGLDERCYRALTLGACVFNKLTGRVHRDVVREIFSPGHDAEARRLSGSTGAPIFGTGYLLPLTDEAIAGDKTGDGFAEDLRWMVESGGSGPAAERHFETVTGFHLMIPEDAEQEEYRLTLLYFSGNPGRGDIHLRACIEDVVPSRMRRVRTVAHPCGDEAIALFRAIFGKTTRKQDGFLLRCYRSVPWLLARAYGGAYVWEQLAEVLHRRQLSRRRPTANSARRMASVVPRLPDSWPDLAHEVVFHLVFEQFLDRYHSDLTVENRIMPMRPWRELIEAVEVGPIDRIEFQSPSELGFACGVLVSQFGRWYWHATKVGGTGKDYLKHRVLTFGTDLTPEAVWRQAVGKMFDVAARYNMPVSEDFRRRAGVTLAALDRMQETVRSHRDDFMTGFWCGYALQGWDRASGASESGDASVSTGERSDR